MAKSKYRVNKKFNTKSRALFLEAIKRGGTIEIACNYAGWKLRTYYYWMATGREHEDGPYWEFADEVKEAQGQGAVRWLKAIDRAIEEGTWQAAAWLLERRQAEHFSKRTNVQHTFDNADLERLAADMGLTVDEVREELKHLKKRKTH